MRKEDLNLTDELKNYFKIAKKGIKNRLLKKDIDREEVSQQVYRETVKFVMKKFQLTLDEAYSYINMNQSYNKMIEIRTAEIIIETNLERNG